MCTTNSTLPFLYNIVFSFIKQKHTYNFVIYTYWSIFLLPKGPLEYLENFKNPCWLDRGKRKSTVKCLPYFYVVGAPKCGTTDLHRRLIQHPDICQYSQKENHWITRKRFCECKEKYTHTCTHVTDCSQIYL